MLLDHVCGAVLFKNSGLKHLEIKFQKEIWAQVPGGTQIYIG